MKIVIIGGVAAGASVAARARRQSEDAEIVILERGEFISFANCGLPYHVSETIPDRSDLLVMTPEKFRGRSNVDARVLQEVTEILRADKKVKVRDRRSGEVYEESYDKLVLATGSSPISPPIPGADDPDVMQFWTIPDMDRVKGRIDQGAKRAVVVGGGFIGLEVVENLREAGVEVSLVEMLPQVFPAMDAEMTTPLNKELTDNNVGLYLGKTVTSFERASGVTETSPEINVKLDDGTELPSDFVIMSIGVRPNSELARDAGLSVSESGSIQVDERMVTSDPDIFAAGDVVETPHLTLQTPSQVPLAGPANRQGRIVADNVFGKHSVYKGSLGTSIVKTFHRAAALTGANEKTLKARGMDYHKTCVHALSHAGYYPGASPVSIKILFDDEGYLLGAQAVGKDGVDKRIDVIATVMRHGGTVYELEDLELAYAPPFGSAKDPVNYAGMTAVNILHGDSDPVAPDNIPEDAFLLDVRNSSELETEPAVPGAQLIPLSELRERVDELPRDKDIVVYCKIGLRAYLAERILRNLGYNAHNLIGGITTYRMFYPDE